MGQWISTLYAKKIKEGGSLVPQNSKKSMDRAGFFRPLPAQFPGLQAAPDLELEQGKS